MKLLNKNHIGRTAPLAGMALAVVGAAGGAWVAVNQAKKESIDGTFVRTPETDKRIMLYTGLGALAGFLAGFGGGWAVDKWGYADAPGKVMKQGKKALEDSGIKSDNANFDTGVKALDPLKEAPRKFRFDDYKVGDKTYNDNNIFFNRHGKGFSLKKNTRHLGKIYEALKEGILPTAAAHGTRNAALVIWRNAEKGTGERLLADLFGAASQDPAFETALKDVTLDPENPLVAVDHLLRKIEKTPLDADKSKVSELATKLQKFAAEKGDDLYNAVERALGKTVEGAADAAAAAEHNLRALSDSYRGKSGLAEMGEAISSKFKEVVEETKEAVK